MQINKGVRCGNHGGIKIYHATSADVHECYEWTRAESLPSWMIDEDPDYIRPLPTQQITIREWWDLPVAKPMWGTDARDLGV